MMNKQNIQQALNYLADKAIPADYDPIPTIRARLESELSPSRKQIERKVHPNRLSLAGLSVLLILLAGMIFFLTSPGRAVAREVLRFFTQAESDVLPLPTGQPAEPLPPTRTVAPTHLLGLQEVTPAVGVPNALIYPTATPAPQKKTSAPIWNLTLDQAAQLAGFELRVPVSLPPGYRLDNVTYDPRTGEVTQFYRFYPYSAGEQFILHQRPSKPTDVIGRSATVNQMIVGGIEVEYVGGSWFNDSSSDAETWHRDSIFHTFRWLEGDLYFSLEILFDDSDTWSPAYWTEDGMLAMVELMIGVRSEFPEWINFNNLTSIDLAEELAGFELLVPSILPQRFVFSRAVYEPQANRVRLFYQPQAGTRAESGVNLSIIQTQKAAQPKTWDGFPKYALEEVMVGSSPAIFARGMVQDGIYNPEAGISLAWDTAELSIQMSYSAPSAYPIRLEKDDLIAIAESLE